MPKKIIFSVGEISADRHAALLIEKIKEKHNDIEISGLGGRRMKNAGADIKFDVTTISTVGITEYYDYHKELESIRDTFINYIYKTNPDLIILMDMEGFNLDIAKRLNHKFKLLYYITPQRWVLRIVGKSFIKNLAKYVPEIITLFEEEQKLYKKHNINAKYFGNPIAESIKITKTVDEVRENFGIKKDTTLIALMPGSRKQEIERLTGILIESAKLINEKLDAEFIIPVSHTVFKKPIENILSNYDTNNINIKISTSDSHNIINACDFVILSSGSATLECALLEKPMLIVYKISKITYLIGKLLYKYKYIALPNMISGKEIVPELLQKDVNPQLISKKALDILNNQDNINIIKKEFQRLKKRLNTNGVINKVAEEIYEILNK